MGSWIGCGRGCGNCMFPVTDEYIRYVDPSDILEWAHKTIDLIEDELDNFTGIPLRFFITCTYEAKISGQIAPKNNLQYSRSRTFLRDLIKHSVSTISHAMITHSEDRRNTAHINSSNGMMLSINDIMCFKRDMDNQTKFSIIHAALDEISIISSNIGPRTQRAIRQRNVRHK